MTNEAPAERPKGHSLRGEKRPKAASSYLPSYSALPWYRRRHTDNVGMNLQVHPRRWHIARTAGKSCHLNRCVRVRLPENCLLRLVKPQDGKHLLQKDWDSDIDPTWSTLHEKNALFVRGCQSPQATAPVSPTVRAARETAHAHLPLLSVLAPDDRHTRPASDGPVRSP